MAMQAAANVSQVVAASSSPCRGPSSLHRWQQGSHQDTDDRNRHEQLNKRHATRRNATAHARASVRKAAAHLCGQTCSTGATPTPLAHLQPGMSIEHQCAKPLRWKISDRPLSQSCQPFRPRRLASSWHLVGLLTHKLGKSHAFSRLPQQHSQWQESDRPFAVSAQ